MSQRRTHHSRPGGTRRPGERGATRPRNTGSFSVGTDTSTSTGSGRIPRIVAPVLEPEEETPRGRGPRGLVDAARERVRDRSRPPERRRPRPTGRTLVLALVLAVLAASFASSLRAYLVQREHIGEVRAEIASTQKSISELEREKARWNDPAYVRQQARSRLNYVTPGETSFTVLGADGKPLDPESRLKDPAAPPPETPDPWWSDAWKSVELAGNPPGPGEYQGPASEIGGDKKKNPQNSQNSQNGADR